MWKLFLSLVLVAVVPIQLPATEPLLTKIVGFGDSLSDNGRLFELTGGQLLPFPYFGGRASNGPVWLEQLATQMEIPLEDNAVIGAQTGFGLREAPPSIRQLAGLTQGDLRIPAIGTQISEYLHAATPTDDSLVVIWGGSNDIFFGQANNSVSVTNMGNHIRRLQKSGVKHVLVPNLPPLGKTPFALGAGAEVQAVLSFLASDFNARLEEELDVLEQELDINIIRFDVEQLVNDVIADPAAFGFLNANFPAIALFGDPNAPPSNAFLFWDDVHPTEAGHALLAEVAEVLITMSVAP